VRDHPGKKTEQIENLGRKRAIDTPTLVQKKPIPFGLSQVLNKSFGKRGVPNGKHVRKAKRPARPKSTSQEKKVEHRGCEKSLVAHPLKEKTRSYAGGGGLFPSTPFFKVKKKKTPKITFGKSFNSYQTTHTQDPGGGFMARKKVRPNFPGNVKDRKLTVVTSRDFQRNGYSGKTVGAKTRFQTKQPVLRFFRKKARHQKPRKVAATGGPMGGKKFGENIS